jgi:hypothetical protein
MHIDGPLFDKDFVTPNLVKQLGPGVHALGCAHQKLQQTKFGRSDYNFATRCVWPFGCDTMRHGVKPHRAEHHQLILRGRAAMTA